MPAPADSMRRWPWKYTGLVALCLLAAILLAWTTAGQQIDFRAYDTLLRLRPPKSAPGGQPGSAVILALDEDTLRAYGGVGNLRRPLVAALQALAGAGARSVAVDIQLADAPNAPLDAELARAFQALPNVVLATKLVQKSGSDAVYWEDPLPEFSGKAALGHVHAHPDLDGVSRFVMLEEAAAGKRRWALALEAFRLASGGGPMVETENGLDVGAVSIPAPRPGRPLRIRYVPRDTVELISMKDFIEQPALASRVRDRAVFIGGIVQGEVDRLMTPYSLAQSDAMTGVEIHAQLYETLRRGDFLTPVADSTALLVALLIAAAMAFGFHRLAGRQAFAWGFAVLIAAHVLPYLFFQRNKVLPLAPPAATAWFCFLGLGTRHYLVTRRRLGLAEAQRDRYQQAVHYVTHEMRTPLTAIQGSSELMSRYSLNDEKRKEIAGLIHSESRRLGRMVEMFLSVERLSAGQLELKREPVPAVEMLSACLERARPLAERKQIGLSLATEPGAGEAILGDREFLEYACYNLVTNAIKYSPAGTGITAGIEASGSTIRLWVKDQGYGMNEQEVKRVFQKFYRTRRAQESGEKGTGIGLALVEEIVVGHGGSIEVESRVNQGSRFTLVLPRAQARVAQPAR